MDASKKKALEATGWKVGDAADFLGMNKAERQLLESRMRLDSATHRQREALRRKKGE